MFWRAASRVWGARCPGSSASSPEEQARPRQGSGCRPGSWGILGGRQSSSDQITGNRCSTNNTLLLLQLPVPANYRQQQHKKKQELHSLLKLKRGWVALWAWQQLMEAHSPCGLDWVLRVLTKVKVLGQLVDQTRFLPWPPQPLWWIFSFYEVYLLPLSISSIEEAIFAAIFAAAILLPISIPQGGNLPY